MKRFTMIVMAAIAATLPAVVADPASTNASSGYNEIFSTEPVNVRVTPNVSGQVIAQLDDGTPTNIRCAIAGQQIWDTNVWFYSDLTNGNTGSGLRTTPTPSTTPGTISQTDTKSVGCERPASTPGASVYYQPRFHLGDPLAPTSAYTAAKDYWAAGNCSATPRSMTCPPTSTAPQLVAQATGRASAARHHLHALAQRQPHSSGQPQRDHPVRPRQPRRIQNNPCDAQYDQDQLMADWLNGDDDRRLLVIAGAWTARRIQPRRRRAAASRHPTTPLPSHPQPRPFRSSACLPQRTAMGHLEIMETFGHLAGSGSITTCPGRRGSQLESRQPTAVGPLSRRLPPRDDRYLRRLQPARATPRIPLVTSPPSTST